MENNDVSIFLHAMPICTTIFLCLLFIRYTYQRRTRHGLAAKEDTLTKGKAGKVVSRKDTDREGR